MEFIGLRLSTIILIVAFSIILAVLIVSLVGYNKHKKLFIEKHGDITDKEYRKYNYTPFEIPMFVSAIVLGVHVIIAALLCVPHPSYSFAMYQTTGNVENITNTFEEGNGEISQEIVVSLDSFDRPVTVDDPRIMGKEGTEVTLNCTKGFHYKAIDTYSCSIAGMESVTTEK